MPEVHENTFTYVIRQDVLSAIPFVSSVYKVNFGITRDIAHCAVAIAGGTCAMWMWNPHMGLEEAARMSGVMLAGSTAFKVIFNLGCRATNTCIKSTAILFSYDSVVITSDLDEVSPSIDLSINASQGPTLTL